MYRARTVTHRGCRVTAGKQHQRDREPKVDRAKDREQFSVGSQQMRDLNEAQENCRHAGGRGRGRQITKHRGEQQQNIEQRMHAARRPVLPCRQVLVPTGAGSPGTKQQSHADEGKDDHADVFMDLIKHEFGE